MLNVTKLLCGLDQPMDALRYGHGSGAPRSARERKPVVVWNVSRTCNLRCLHCYSDSYARKYPGELTHAQGIELLKDLAAFGVPAVLLSGGEPLARRDALDLAEFGRMLALKFTLSTNGTLTVRPATPTLVWTTPAPIFAGVPLSDAARSRARVPRPATIRSSRALRIAGCDRAAHRVQARVTSSATS